MEYAFSEERSSTTSMSTPSRVPRLRIIPTNATYKNTYNSSGTTESTLNLRLVPIPAPEVMTEIISVPNPVGMELEQATAILSDLGLFYQLNRLTQGVPQGGKNTEVVGLSLADGTVLFSANDLGVTASQTVVAHSELVLNYVQQEKETQVETNEPVLKDPNGTYQLKLIATNTHNASAIKIVREITNLGLTDAKKLVESAPILIDCSLSLADAKAYVTKFEEAGVSASIRSKTDQPEAQYQMELLNVGEKKIDVIKIVREVTGLGLKESKELVEAAPVLIEHIFSKADVIAYLDRFTEVGATVAIREVT